MARVQRLTFPDRTHSVTVIGADRLPVPQAREYLRFLTDEGASPNTVKSYAYGLAAWWTVLEHTGHAWDDFPTTLFGEFLRYLRSGDLPNTARIGPQSDDAGMADSSLQPRGAAVLSMYRYFADAYDLTRPYRRLYSSHARTARRNPYSPFLAGVGPQQSRDQPIYRHRTPNRTETPILLPSQVVAILDACSTQTEQDWSGEPPGYATDCCSRFSPKPGCVWAKHYRCATTTFTSVVATLHMCTLLAAMTTRTACGRSRARVVSTSATTSSVSTASSCGS